MQLHRTVLLAALLSIPSLASAQSRFDTAPGATPLMEISVGYTFRHANAPPGQCGCFNANGGVGSVVLNAPHGFSFVTDISGAHASAISGTVQSITVINYLFGARYSLRSIPHGFTPYAEGLGGAAHESSNYAYPHSLSGPAFAAGGGITKALSHRIGWNIVDTDWIHSQLSNAQNNRQNDLRLSTAITIRLGPR